MLRCNIVEGTPKSGGEIFEVTKAEVNGALDEKSCGAVVALRLQRAKSGEDALQLLHEIFVRCRDEARTARSRNDDACEKAVHICGNTAASLASVCLVRPGALGKSSEKSRETLASALLGKVPQLRPEFLQGALAKVSPELLKDVAGRVEIKFQAPHAIDASA